MAQMPHTVADSVGGEVLASHNRRPEAYAAGRRCQHADCPTLLSIYNSGDFCSVHASAGAVARGGLRRPLRTPD